MRHYYAASNTYGTNLSHDSIGWKAHMFGSKSDRDEWVDDHCYSENGNIVAESADSKTAHKIAGKSKHKHMISEPGDNSFEWTY